MDKLVEIRLTKCKLFLKESELIKLIPSPLFEEGLKRGKGILRNQKFKERIERS